MQRRRAQHDEGTVVEMVNQQTLAEVTESPGMRQIATEVSGRLEAAMDALRAPT